MPLTAIATVAGSAAIQLNVAKLILGEREQPVIGICVFIVDNDAFINSWSYIALVMIEYERPRLVQTVVRSKLAHRGKPRRVAPASLTLRNFTNDRDIV